MCIRDRYQRRVHGDNCTSYFYLKLDKVPLLRRMMAKSKDILKSKIKKEDNSSIRRKRHKRLSKVEKERLLDMVLFQQTRFRAAAKELGIHHLTAKNIIDRWKLKSSKPQAQNLEVFVGQCNVVILDSPVEVQKLQITTTIGGMSAEKYHNKMVMLGQVVKDTDSIRCSFIEIESDDSPGSEVKRHPVPWIICSTNQKTNQLVGVYQYPEGGTQGESCNSPLINFCLLDLEFVSNCEDRLFILSSTYFDQVFSQTFILRQLYFCARYQYNHCLLYTSPSPRDGLLSRMPSSA
eukprot:TRINITY_DN579_c0_g2_i2.p1 TRINITY_DN579_c0_g2~~TRINITY_DN579_c0_g2_i2.p1  ORF type:complete len:308 (-),score=24.77 TRINITY_DN579_c0_g2_i2:96-971(-)